jgi:hypothetical protein
MPFRAGYQYLHFFLGAAAKGATDFRFFHFGINYFSTKLSYLQINAGLQIYGK